MTQSPELQDIKPKDFIHLLGLHSSVENYRIKGVVSFAKNHGNSLWKNITSCHFIDDVEFNGCENVSLEVSNCTFNRKVLIKSGYFEKLSFENITCEEFNIIGGTFKSKLWVYIKKVNSFLISGGEFLDELVVSSSVELDGNAKINSFTLSPQVYKDLGKINIISLDIDSIGLVNRLKSDLMISQIRTNSIEFIDLHNLGSFSIDRITPLNDIANFNLISTDLACTISNIDFTNIRFLLDSKSNISKIKTINVIWFKDIIVLEDKPSSIIREYYRQLKLAMLNQGDKIQALEFESKELYYHHKSLKGQKRKGADKFILFTNRINNHGQNWWRATWVFFLLSCGFYTLIKFFLGHTQFEPSMIGYDLGGVFSLMNPTHATGILKPDIKTSGGAFFLDSIFRIISAYFIFQIVVAFRKFVNR